MPEPLNTEEVRPEKDEETREANTVIGFYDESGNQLSPEEFERLFSGTNDRGEE